MGKKYIRVKARRLLEVYMTLREVKVGQQFSTDMQKIDQMADHLLQWMAEYCSRKSFNPLHWLDVWLINNKGIKIEADHWLANPQKLGQCLSNPRLFFINE
jgi:hypothetical protein